MRWFKHMTGAHRDEALCRMMDEFGLEGYGAYWIVLETIAAQCEKKGENSKTSLTLSVKNWRKIVPFAPQKLVKWLAFAAQLNLFSAEISENLVTVSCPKLLKYRDEYSFKKAKCRDIVGTKSALDTDTDTEAETDIKIQGACAPASEISSGEKSGKPEQPEQPEGEKPKPARFVPPSVAEVDALINARCYLHANAEEFVNFYASKGWLVGKNPMKDWGAALAGWNSRGKARVPGCGNFGGYASEEERLHRDPFAGTGY